MTIPRCPLGKLIHSIDAERIKREGWQRDRILVVSLDDDRLDWTQRKEVEQLGDYLYPSKGTK